MKKAINLITIIAFFFCIAESCSKKDPAKPALPKADFTIKSDANGKIVFRNTSTNASKFLWDFGNNLTSAARDTSVQYIKNTTYKVSLTASSADGKSDKKEIDIVISNIEIPTHMSFDGTLGTKKISLVDGVENISFKNYYVDCCANYKTEVYQNNNRAIYCLISQSEMGGNTSKTYQDIVKNIFVKGYNISGTITPFWSGIGMYIDYVIDSDRSAPFEDKKIEVIEVLKEENKTCSCDNESFWIKYKVEIKNLKGILTIKYLNPCCLK
jgi:PKD repeat protein